jgi:hypothetical protein
MRPRVLVVSYYAANPFTPRGARTAAVASALVPHANVHVIAAPRQPTRRTLHERVRDRALSKAGSRWLIDPVEPWAWRAFARYQPDADVGLLVGYPFSPLVAAARALRCHGVPYVVDMSDPWSRTRPDGRPPTVRERRSARLERLLWQGAAAGIVTTASQARDALDFAPGLPVLVRPNGYSRVPDVPPPLRRHDRAELRLGHFGHLYGARGDMRGFMRRLAESGLWRRVVLRQYGDDTRGDLRALAQWVAIEQRDPAPWPEVVRSAAPDLDAAIVVGWNDVRQLPSKAIEYLTLPVPRIALTNGPRADALAQYVDGKPGWLIAAFQEPAPAPRVLEHVDRDWTADELGPPPGEAWGVVADEIAGFVLQHARSRRGGAA